MELLFTFLVFSSVCGVMASDPDLSPLEDEFTPETYAYFNMSKKTKKFDLKDIEGTARRWDIWWYRWFAAKHKHTRELNDRACYFLAITYLAAIPEIRRYFNVRFLYVNTLEYEVGYVVYDIVYKYQMMIEIYQIMYNKYYLQQTRWAVPVTYIFYMYRNVLELGTSIMHLCNMLHEIEKKYERQKIGHWDDYPMSGEEGGKKKDRNYTDKYKEATNDYLKRREAEIRQRMRDRKKGRKEVHFDTKITTPRRQPYKSFWPLHYGWSIEFW